jgi:hypothetical protein
MAENPIAAFLWGNGGERLTPEEVAHRRRAASELAAQDIPGMGHWAAALNQGLTGFFSGREAGAAREGERLGREGFQTQWDSVFGDPVAGALASGAMPDMSQLYALASDPWGNDSQRSIVQSLIAQQLQEQAQARDPMRQLQLQKAQLELDALRNPGPAKPVWQGDRWWDISSGQPVPLTDVAPGAGGDARDRQIERIMSIGVPREVAVGIADGVLRGDTNPVTGEFMVTNMATGLPAYAPPAMPEAPEPSPLGPDVSFGPQFPSASESFGVGGAARSAANTALDVVGVPAPYRDVQQAQADFAILRESLLNDIAESYGRQPPSWLLKEIRDLTPEAGNPFQGAQQAQTKLKALGRHLENERRMTRLLLTRQMKPDARAELETRLVGLDAGLARVQGALESFSGETPETSIDDLLRKYQ